MAQTIVLDRIFQSSDGQHANPQNFNLGNNQDTFFTIDLDLLEGVSRPVRINYVFFNIIDGINYSPNINIIDIAVHRANNSGSDAVQILSLIHI